MRKSLIILGLFTILNLSSALGQTGVNNTIYLFCNRDDLKLSVNEVREATKQVVISFFFTKSWTIWGDKQSQIMLMHTTKPIPDKQWGWIATSENIEEIKKLSNLMTLDQFVEKLNQPDFVSSLGSMKLVMLLGWTNGKKFERYPVKVGTSISDPHDLNIPEQKPVKPRRSYKSN